MAHPYHHSLSSVKKWGGNVDDYQPIHDWFDQSKQIIADFRHRALRHHAEGIFMLVIWTGKLFLQLSLMEGVVLVVHRRGRAAPGSAYQRASGADGGEVPVDPPGRATGPYAISLTAPFCAWELSTAASYG